MDYEEELKKVLALQGTYLTAKGVLEDKIGFDFEAQLRELGRGISDVEDSLQFFNTSAALEQGISEIDAEGIIVGGFQEGNSLAHLMDNIPLQHFIDLIADIKILISEKK